MKSAVAGIIDDYGGLRVVVTERRRFRYHIRQGEKLFIVPKLRVQEPVPWNDIPWLIGQVENYIAEWIRGRNDPDDLEDLPVKLYRLRCLEGLHSKRALNLEHIAET